MFRERIWVYLFRLPFLLISFQLSPSEMNFKELKTERSEYCQLFIVRQFTIDSA